MKTSARLPWFTLGASAVVLALGFSPTWSAALQLDRTALDQHEYWRLLGAHFTHWTAGHLACELAAFVACGCFLEQASRTRMIRTTVVSAICVSIAIVAFAPEIGSYRGLSGIVGALLAAAAIELVRHAKPGHSRLAGSLAVAAIIALLSRTVFDFVEARAVLDLAINGSAPVPIAHLAGIATGLCIALLPCDGARKRSEATIHSR